MSDELTPEQIENLRIMLVGVVGPYALLMSAEEIRKFRDKFQTAIDEATE